VGFPAVSRIVCGYEVEVEGGMREAMVRQQVQGGRIINSFLQAIEASTKSLSHTAQEKELL
jgi:hypothetical protein